MCTSDWLTNSCTCYACGARAESYEQWGIGMSITPESVDSTDNAMQPRVITDEERERFAKHRRAIAQLKRAELR